MITTKTNEARGTRRSAGSAVREATAARGRGVPRRALNDGITERRRTPRRRDEPALTNATEVVPATHTTFDALPGDLSAVDHYRMEMERRQRRVAGDLSSLLAEAKAEYEAMINAPRPAGKGGRPKKKPAVKKDEFDLEEFGEHVDDEP